MLFFFFLFSSLYRPKISDKNKNTKLKMFFNRYANIYDTPIFWQI